MVKPLFALTLFATIAPAQDAHTLLSKARTAFLDNQPKERYWIWTSTTTRSILAKSGKPLDRIPSVTIESPIRSDGRRCNAVVAWGDGVEPYLAHAPAEQRCTVEAEVPPVFRMQVLLESSRVTLSSRTDSEIILALHPHPHSESCEDSLEGAIALDPETAFPKRVDLTVAGDACQRKAEQMQEHYSGATVKSVGGYLKGTQLHFDYELQRDKTGDASRNFWIAAHRRLVQPFPKNVTGVLISGRNFKLTSKGQERQAVTETVTKASETSAESVLKFESK